MGSLDTISEGNDVLRSSLQRSLMDSSSEGIGFFSVKYLQNLSYWCCL